MLGVRTYITYAVECDDCEHAYEAARGDGWTAATLATNLRRNGWTTGRDLPRQEARRDYGFVPTAWKEARDQLADVGAGEAHVVLHLGSALLLRGGRSEKPTVLFTFLRRLHERASN